MTICYVCGETIDEIEGYSDVCDDCENPGSEVASCFNCDESCVVEMFFSPPFFCQPCFEVREIVARYKKRGYSDSAIEKGLREAGIKRKFWPEEKDKPAIFIV